MKLKFNKRKFFYFGEEGKSISIEICGFNANPAISFYIDGKERDVTFHLGFIIGIYLTFTNFLPKSWYPQDKSETYGQLPGERELSIKFHHWYLWWCFWKDNTSWSNTDSKFRSGYIDFAQLIKGKHSCEWNIIEKEMHIISFIEGNYQVEVIKKNRIDKWQRWFSSKSISYEVKAGYYVDNNWIECPIPIEGKGENSWDCDEDARYSLSMPAKNEEHDIKNCKQAAMYFEYDIKKDRVRYGGNNWIPQAYRNNDILIIDNSKQNINKKERTFTETEISQLQSEVYKITGKGEVMQLFNSLLGINAGNG
ncbi:MAG TPA: hypothetical protein PKD00_03165 [Burkholderiales bacterium]|nr:hypothetical protein [Burkholderiales bacterium]